MYARKRFRLKEAVLGIEKREGRHVALPIPSGEVVAVLSGPNLNDIRMVTVLWQDRVLIMFAEDLESHGTELKPSEPDSITRQTAAM